MGIETAVTLDDETCYSVFKAHDVRFDGRMFVGVSSTGIYCRPVCRVKTPKKENCSFYGNAAAAEAAGFRPCLRCRPELAPGSAPVDSSTRLSQRAVLLMEEHPNERSLEELADELDVTDRHLRRVFASEYGVSPIQYMQTHRLLLAKSLLTDTNLPASKVASAAGFGSIRRFNTLFKEHYDMTPTELRERTKRPSKESITLFLGYRPPYQWTAIISFLEARAIPGVETVTDDSYSRTAALQHNGETYRGWLIVRNAEKRNALSVTVSESLLPVLPKILARVKNMFDLQCDPEEIFSRLSVMNDIKEGMCIPGTRLPGSFDAFEMAVRAILGQQITVKAARTLATRIVSSYGVEVETPINGLTHNFPTPEELLELEGKIEDNLGVLGITSARSRSIHALASGIINGDIDLSRSADPDIQMKRLLELPGFGPWTVQYVAMRALGWPDAFPHTDYGVKKALEGRSQKGISELAEQWRPWRSYATINLWNSLG